MSARWLIDLSPGIVTMPESAWQGCTWMVFIIARYQLQGRNQAAFPPACGRGKEVVNGYSPLNLGPSTTFLKE